MTTAPPPRLALLIAARAPVAVIFRRGPSKHVEIIRWDLAADRFERGHWFTGRIHDKRSDLSPDGELLVYFAAKYVHPTPERPHAMYAWTAVSRAPWLTALALWPKTDAWWGGGLFTGPRDLWLNHPPDQADAHPGHPTRGLRVETNPDASGENEPVYARRLDRDGWAPRQAMKIEAAGARGVRTLAPEERIKPLEPGSDDGASIVLERRIDGFSYRERFRIEGSANEPELPPGPLDWLDRDPAGRLIALSGGRVWAATVEQGRIARFTPLLDLRGDVLEAREPPPAAVAPLEPHAR